MSGFILKSSIPLFFLFAAELASANSTRREELAELVGHSQKVFIGTVTSIYRPSAEIPGIREVAEVNVDLSYKGPASIGRVRLVTKGFMAELYMTCCVVGHRYMFFVKDGYDVLAKDGQDFQLQTVGTEKYVSPANGRFSSYELDRDLVIGWGRGSDASAGVGLDQAVRQVRALLGDSNTGRVYSPSELNAQPERFANQHVTVSGFIRLTPGGHTFFESEALAKEFEGQYVKPDPSFNPRNYQKYCLTIANPDFMYDAPQDIDRHAVVLHGTFVAPYLGENQLDHGACALNTAIRVDERDFARRYPAFFRKPRKHPAGWRPSR